MSLEFMMSGGPFYHHPFESPSYKVIPITRESSSAIKTIVIIAERHCGVYGDKGGGEVSERGGQVPRKDPIIS
jgi:hypothetical protein